MTIRRHINLCKAGQLKMLESIGVLIVFCFLVGIGLKFYGNMELQNLKEAKDAFLANDATKISQKIAHLPELRCTLENTDQGSCIDLYQAQSWAKLSSGTDCIGTISVNAGDLDASAKLCSQRLTHYFEQIGYGEIILKRLYSSDLNNKVIPTASDYVSKNVYILYNFTEKNITRTSFTFTQIPVVIFDSLSQVRDFGILSVKVYHGQ